MDEKWLAGLKTLIGATTIVVVSAGGLAAMADESQIDIESELRGDFFTQIAASGENCYVDRIRKEWQDAGEPTVKGWSEEVTDPEAEAAYQCVIRKLASIYGKIERFDIGSYQNWRRYNTVAYPSGTHGGRMVNNYGNETGNAYGKFEESGVMPVGTVLVKDSFGVNKKGEVKVGPIFTMIKMENGFNSASADWEYALYTPGGKLMGSTNGENSGKVEFCISCHVSAEDFDQMFFLPDDYRVN
ncbi:MAG: cytochrome P460 family protein [Alphaproteobacteria bacterium]